MAITIPEANASATHCTDGLSGFPAEDFFGSLGEPVHIGENGVLFRPHLIPWQQGFGGWTFYFYGTTSNSTYFVTHLEERDGAKGGTYRAGDWIGYLTASPSHAALINGAHVHVGNTLWVGSGLQCGPAVPPSPTGVVGTIGQPGASDNPMDYLQGPIGGPAAVRGSQLPQAWNDFTKALSHTLPTQLRRARVAERAIKRVTR